MTFITGIPRIVPDVTVNNDAININGNSITFNLSWGEPFNNLDPIVNYTVSCSGDVTCPPNFTTTDNTKRSYTITNLTPMTNYTFSVVATNSIGSGEAGVKMIITPQGVNLTTSTPSEVITTTTSSDSTTYTESSVSRMASSRMSLTNTESKSVHIAKHYYNKMQFIIYNKRR